MNKSKVLKNIKKNSQKKAYYREFNDDDSFSSLAMQEIRLWLRGITKTARESAHLDNNPLNTDNTETNLKAEAAVESLVDNNDTDSRDFDNEAGFVDCVVYITDAAKIMLEEINKFSDNTNHYAETTRNVTNELQYLNGQKNSSTKILALLKKYASEINIRKDVASSILDRIESKWNEIYKYLIIYNNHELNTEDRIIVANAISRLKECFEKVVPTMDEIIYTFVATPNHQKELKKSMNGLADVYKRFKAFTIKAIDNCEEIETSFSVIA